MLRPTHLLIALLTVAPRALVAGEGDDPRPFVIRVVDDQTGRGVPLVELRTTNEIVLVTDSAGVVVFREPGLMDQTVFFSVKSHGYEFPKDGFGMRGKALKVEPGGSAELRVRRVNIAERLYRVTGQGIYRDSVLAGREAPLKKPLLNAQLLGSDSVLTALYQGSLYWFWGDTNRPGYPLGNFHMTGATSKLPADGGLDPDLGVDLDYFTGSDGFVRGVCKMPGDGPTWATAITVLRDAEGRERMVGAYAKIRNFLETYERGLVEWDDASGEFRQVKTFSLDLPARPDGHPLRHQDGGVEYVYFCTPYPLTRVRATVESYLDLEQYECFTCLAPGSRMDQPRVARDADGRPIYAWRRDTPPTGPAEQARLIKDGLLREDEALIALRDFESGRPVVAHSGTVSWNEHRRRWVLIAVEQGGTASLLGEVWYAEANAPVGPWAYARKIVTHDRYTFYNPKQHHLFDQDGGRIVYFEGTYSRMFSGNPVATPRYDYNQIMYRLDLGDARLRLPVGVRVADGEGGAATYSTHARSGPIAFFAHDRPAEGLVPVFANPGGGLELDAEGDGRTPLFYARPFSPDDTTPGTRVLTSSGGEDGRPIGRVWVNPVKVALPGVGSVP
jgi:hypothetical protein